MSIVYILFTSEYATRGVEGVFASREAAETAWASYKAALAAKRREHGGWKPSQIEEGLTEEADVEERVVQA